MKVREVISALERFAPLPLQDGFDNAGLQVGLTEDAEVTRALLCLDVTEAIVDEALATGCNLIVSHHPLLFKGCKTITGKDYVERCVMKAIAGGVAIYAAHTNLDNVSGGVNYKMAEKIGLVDVKPLDPRQESLLKLVTYVPTSQADDLRSALFAAGCGHIGAYDGCSWNVEGQGTFRALEGTHPYCGRVGEKHVESEVRIETILPAYLRGRVVKALLEAHPYEEPAYDLYALKNTWTGAGSGAVGELQTPETETEFLKRIKKTFEVACVRHTRLTGRLIRRVALCGGAGSFLIPTAVAAGADVFITGEMRYHEFFGREQDILLAELGHYETEQYTKDLLFEILTHECPGLDLQMTKLNTNPIKYM